MVSLARVFFAAVLCLCGGIPYLTEQVEAARPSGVNQQVSDQARLGQGASSLKGVTSTISLTEEERAWLRAHPVIRVVQDPGWPPVEFVDEHGQPSGMTADYLTLIERRVGVTFERVRDLSWQEAYGRLKRWEIDMTTSVAVTPERERFWTFTKPYMKIPIVILTEADVTYVGSMRELAGKKVAVVDGYAVSDWIPRDYPDIRLVRVRNAKEGLDLLERGDVFAYIDNMLVVSYYLAKLKAANVKIAGATPYVNAQSMAVRKDWPILAGILQKALDSISKEERDDIYYKWVPIRYEHGFNYRLLWRALAVFAVILLWLVVWNRKLSREIRYRKRAEADLSTSEQRFRQLFEAATMPMCFIDNEGALVDFNKCFVETFGYSREEITTLNEWQQFVCRDPDYRRWAADTWQSSVHRAVEKKTLIEAGEYRLTCKSGETRTFVVSGAILGDNVLAAFFDITERQRAEEALLASQLRLTEAMDLAGIVYWEVDPKTVEFIFNDPFYTFYGTTAEREGGYRMSREEYGKRFVHPDDMYIFQQAAEKRLASKEREFQNDVEHRIVRRDGEVRHIFARIHVSRDATGRVTRYYGANQDITERKKQEEERAKLWSAVERAGEGVFMLTPDGSCFSYVNAAFCKAYGFTHEELVGKSTAMTRSDRHPQSFHDSLWSDLQMGKTWSGRQTRQRKDGALIEVETTIAPVRDTSGTIIHYVGVERDITQQLQLESQLRQAQKMEAIGTLAGGVAHDFNNILTVIMGLANLMQMSVGPDDRLRRHIDQIVLSSERAAELTRSLLAFSRKQQIDVKPHDVNAVVASTAKLLKRLLPEDVELRVNLADHSLVTLLDTAQIDQVLINLATNARDAMPNGGSLTISILAVELEESFKKTHGFGKPGRYVLLSVSDTGIGMNEETMARIFDPFFTTKEVGKGTGLGLSSVYGIVKQHGGYVDVTSKVLKGTTFDVYLPLVNTVARHATAESFQVKGGSETILVIEDDADVRKMMITVLSDQGYTILEAANGETAIRVFDEHKDATSLVILDVVMPGKNGREVLDVIARLNPLIKAIFVSGYTGDIVLDKGVQEDGVDFLEKPISVAKLLSKIREVLDR